jgi:rSAM/selenodomain-associated transferase 2
MTCPLSIIIPVAQEDSAWRELLRMLIPLREEAEILIAATKHPPRDWNDLQQSWGFETLASPIKWLNCPAGRASQMNEAARQAKGQHLWFLHADSHLSEDALSALMKSLDRFPDDLHYFDLNFQSDGPVLMRLNAWGVWIRSHWFKMPFGDQGLSVSAENFHALRGFDDSLFYGEDHHFIWRTRIAGLKLRSVGTSITTSARKYRDRGWLTTTCRHVWLTWRQALPLWCQLWKRRLFG